MNHVHLTEVGPDYINHWNNISRVYSDTLVHLNKDFIVLMDLDAGEVFTILTDWHLTPDGQSATAIAHNYETRKDVHLVLRLTSEKLTRFASVTTECETLGAPEEDTP